MTATARRVGGVVSVLAVGAIALAGCGGGDPSREEARPARLNLALTEPSPGRLRFLAPKSVPAGPVEINFTNLAQQHHKAQLWRIVGDHSIAEALRSRLSPIPDWLLVAGGSGTAQAGGMSSAVQRLRPGTYLIADTPENRAAAPLRVTARAAPGKLPKASATITADDYYFRISGIEAGRRSVTFRNVGTEPHHAFLTPLRGRARLGDVLQFLKRRSGIPPVDADRSQETAILGGGQRQVAQLDLAPGRYALLCFVRNRKGGPRHLDRGMVGELAVR
ncbi:MAG: hypothetical protein M3301_00515 [Chloroflexota bacterium]|nr:hypothetical protein [Chloroflexota bacterium]